MEPTDQLVQVAAVFPAKDPTSGGLWVLDDLEELLRASGGRSQSRDCEPLQILREQVYTGVHEVHNNLVPVIQQLSREADHHLRLAALRLAVDYRGEIGDGFPDRLFDAGRCNALAL